jgi:hypothetical protein
MPGDMNAPTGRDERTEAMHDSSQITSRSVPSHGWGRPGSGTEARTHSTSASEFNATLCRALRLA